ncbi:Uncharacterised protein [Bordetella pertussis]|nr:Uncharacterised protein [Bordetella pertussis]
MFGGTITSGRSQTLAVCGAYWMSCIRLFSNTTWPGVVATLRPISNCVSSVWLMRPRWMSLSRLAMPSCKVRPALSTMARCASGLKARKLAGDMASTHCMTEKRKRLRMGSLTCAASTRRAIARADSR